jgi:hypothetical protein
LKGFRWSWVSAQARQTGAVFCALPVENRIHPRELRTNHRKAHSPRTKKGAGASPLFLITDPPKPESQSRLGSGHPGKPIFLTSLPYWRANGVPACNRKFTIKDLHETTGVSLTAPLKPAKTERSYLQNPTGKHPHPYILWERRRCYTGVIRRSDETNGG